MSAFRLSAAMLALIAVGTLVGCAPSQKSPDVSDSIRSSLNAGGLKSVSVSQDRDKGIVTLGGQVASEDDKARAESIATALAGPQVVANQVAVIPVGGEADAKVVNADLDKGIEMNLHAALVQNKMDDFVKYTVQSGVVTLTGEVNSKEQRDDAETVAAKVPNVKQVVNTLQFKYQKARSSK